MAGTVWVQAAALSAVPPPPDPPPAGTSPTGRDPAFLWTAAQQGVWDQMRSTNDWFWINVLNNANKTGTASERYADHGEWCTFVYQVTGDTAYAAKAITKLLAGMNVATTAISANTIREYWAAYLVMTDWLWPALSGAQRATIMGYHSDWADYCLGIGTGSPYKGGFSYADTDQMHGQFAGLAILHYFNVAENTRYLNLLNQTDAIHGISIGGIDDTAVAKSTVRNAIEWYATYISTGGMWMESSEYNSGTALLMMLLVESMRSALGTDHFPLSTQFIKDYCHMAWYEITPDGLATIQWGDEQNSGSFRQWAYWRTIAAFSGIAEALGDTTAAGLGLAAANYIYSLASASIGDHNLHHRAFFTYNPFATVASLPTGQTGFFAGGMNMQYVKDANSLFWSFTPPNGGQHHECTFGQTFQLYRNGEFCVREVGGYDQTVSFDNISHNSVVLAGLRSHMGARDLVRQEEGAGWWCTTSTTSGGYYAAGYYDPPPAFVNSLERRVVYFKEGGFDVIVVRDVIDAVDPRTLAKFTRYRTSNPDDQSAINAQEAVKVFLLHTPTLPSWSGNVATWVTGGGQTCTQHVLLPAAITTAVVNESTTGKIAAASGILASQKKYHTKFYESPENQVTTALQVIICGNGTQPAISGASASGVTVGSRVVTFGASSTTVD